MSQQKKQRSTTTNLTYYMKLHKLGFSKCKCETLMAYCGLLLVSRGKKVTLPRAMAIIKESKLDLKLLKNTNIPTTNKIESLIYLVITRRQLLNSLCTDKTLAIWSDETAKGMLELLEEISKVYKV